MSESPLAGLPAHVTVVEVGPRDGLQNESAPVPTEAKVRFIDLLSASGLPVIEATSFVRPRAIPQLADADAVFAAIGKAPGVRYPVLVPNVRGMERALAAGVRDVAVFTAASETFTRRNINATIAESLAAFAGVADLARAHDIRLRGYVSTAFGCPYEGAVPPAKVRDVTARLFALGVAEVSIGDTIGVATPSGIVAVLDLLLARFPGRPAGAAPARHARHRARQRVHRLADGHPHLRTRRRAASAAAPTRPAPRVTLLPRTCSTCSMGWASPRAWIWAASSRPAPTWRRSAGARRRAATTRRPRPPPPPEWPPGPGRDGAPARAMRFWGLASVHRPLHILLRAGALLALFPLLLAATPPGAAAAPDPGARYFPETGFAVPARFMTYWSAHGGLPIFGYPISPAEMEGGRLVQYFERNRFEYHPELAGTPYEIELGLLGVTLTQGRTFRRHAPFPNNPTHVFFAQTGYDLGGSFLAYWRNHGGLAVFGYPISQEIQERNPTDGTTYTVQYFERNRFEYHPEHAGTPYDVQLGLLGRDLLATQGRLELQHPPASGPFPGWNPLPPLGYPLPPAGSFLQGPHAALGVTVHMYDQDHTRVLDAVQDVGFNWIKQQVQWKDIEGAPGADAWGELDGIVADAKARGLHILLSVVKPPDWANGGGNGFPRDPAMLGNFMQALAAHYKGQVDAYEVWNEQNLYVESGDLNPAHYAALLDAGYHGVKAGDPQAVVVAGALTPTGIYDDKTAKEDTWYLDQLYQWNNGAIRQDFDVLGSHPYGYNNPPDTMWPDNPSNASAFTTHGQFYYRRVEQQRQVMEKYGDGAKQIWLTEWGWCSDYRPDGYAECAETTPDEQASYTVAAIAQAQQDYPWMGVMFVWNLNFSTFQPWYTGPAHFSLVDPDWTPRPIYTALKALLHGGP